MTDETRPAAAWTVDEEDDRAILMETIAQVDREGFQVDTAEKAAWLTSVSYTHLTLPTNREV